MYDFPDFRQITATSPMMAYKPTSAKEIVQKGLHFGQRKLLLSELEYLVPIVKNASKEVLIVYAGAANGLHLPFLFSCFPKCFFILIDPAPFCERLEKMFSEKHIQLLELIHECCTEEICKNIKSRYASYEIHFISDIRSGNPPDLTNFEHTKLIEKDNEMQRRWAIELSAKTVMLKFHPPYPSHDKDDLTPDTISYIDGIMLWGVWGPKSTTEVRLVAAAPYDRTKSYNCLDHEQQCYYYNTTQRYQSDVAAERGILATYLKWSEVYNSTVEDFSKKISFELGTPLFLPLSEGFTENDARTFALLYYARCERIEEYFSEWRNILTFELLAVWSSGGPPPSVTDFSKYAYRKTLTESFNLPPPKRPRDKN